MRSMVKSLPAAVLAATVSFSPLSGGAALAAETTAINYPIGSLAPAIGEFSPIPGLFIVNQARIANQTGQYDASGHRVSSTFHITTYVDTVHIIGSLPFQFLGANLSSQLIVPIVHVDAMLPKGRGVFAPASAEGIGNLTFEPLYMNWVVGERHRIGFGVDFTAPTGPYTTAKALNVGTNYGTIAPILSYSYRDPSGFEFGINPRLMFNLANTNSTSPQFALLSRGAVTSGTYRTGTILATDFNVGYNWEKWKFAIVGSYVNQLTADKVNGVTALDTGFATQGGNKYKTLLAGPSISYRWGPVSLNLNYQHAFSISNGSKSENFWFNAVFPLYSAPPAGMAVAAK